MRTIVIALFCLSLALPVQASEMAPGKGVKVKSARATWTTGFFLEALASRGLEDLGYKVENPKDLSVPIFYQSVTRGDIDFWANGWFPLHNAQLPKDFKEHAQIAGTISSGGALQGFLASKKDVEKFDIKSLDDFKRPEVKKAFDDNGDGKADLVACPAGWGCEKAISRDLDVYELRDDINPIKAGYSASMADALARYNAGKPILFYTWTPNWTIFKLKPGEDVVWINVPEPTPEVAKEHPDLAGTASGVKGAVSDPLRMGFLPNDICIVANNKFLQDNPAAAELFKQIKLPLADIASQNAKLNDGENKPRDIKRHVNEWIEANRATWDSWIAAAREAANKPEVAKK